MKLRLPVSFVLCIAVFAPFRAAAQAQQAPPSATRELPPDPCLELEDDSAAAAALRGLRITTGGTQRPITAIRFVGLSAVSEDQLWRLVGRRPQGALTPEQAAVVVDRVASTGLFSRVEPTLRLDEGAAGAVLEVAVAELPQVSRVEVRGLTEVRPEDLLEALFETPSGRHDEDDEDAEDDGEDEDDGDFEVRVRSNLPTRCPPPVPPRSMLARLRHGKVVPGLVWKGVQAGLGRVLEQLYDDGYLLATLQAELHPDGTLLIDVDEGRLEALELVGVSRDLEAEVREELALSPGSVFVLADVKEGVRRVERRFPFLDTTDAGGDVAPRRRVVERGTSEGRLLYGVEEERAASRRGHPEKRRFSWVFDSDRGADRGVIELPEALFHLDLDVPDYVDLDGRRVRLHFRGRRTSFDLDGLELLRHTPVTSWAPGLEGELRLWDPENRVHFAADLAANFNTGRRDDRPVDYLIGPKVQLPMLRLAEVGAQLYSLTDTADRWRVTRLDSYLHSMILNRPFSDYYGRTGWNAFATAHLARQLTVGAEYRNDTYRSLDTVTGRAWFDRIGAWPNRPIDEGQMVSVIGRLEWSTRKSGPDDLQSRWRDPERALVDRDWNDDLESGLQTVNTVEVADPAMGSDFQFIRVVSDTQLHLRTGHDQGLRLRVRGAGGQNLPAQKLEALGGWGSLRGYVFKEFVGDMSALGMAEYHFGFVSAFVDAGTVRQPTGWIAPKVGLGGAFNFGPHAQLTLAWRTDERAHLAPEAKFVIGRTF